MSRANPKRPRIGGGNRMKRNQLALRRIPATNPSRECPRRVLLSSIRLPKTFFENVRALCPKFPLQKVKADEPVRERGGVQLGANRSCKALPQPSYSEIRHHEHPQATLNNSFVPLRGRRALPEHGASRQSISHCDQPRSG